MLLWVSEVVTVPPSPAQPQTREDNCEKVGFCTLGPNRLTSDQDDLLGTAGAHGIGDCADEGGVDQSVH